MITMHRQARATLGLRYVVSKGKRHIIHFIFRSSNILIFVVVVSSAFVYVVPLD
jgi:hypothetical protein